MRDVAVVSFRQLTASRDRERNEVEFIIPVAHEAVTASGLERNEIGFTVSGSCDYLSGGPFTFVSGLDAVGAWPPVKESHVEMDAAWALYEAWVAIQVGDVDSALIYGFGKSSLGDVDEIMTLQNDPYYVAPLWPSMTNLAALSATTLLEESRYDEADLAAVGARCASTGVGNEHAVRAETVSTDEALARPVTQHPLRDLDVFPVTDGAAAMVIASGDLARDLCERPAWIRGIEHRVEPQALGLRDLTTSTSTAAAAAGAGEDRIDVAELHTQYSHEELILRDALGLSDDTSVNPSGGPLCANPLMASGLIRVGEVAQRIWSGDADRGLAHASQGPCMQQNLVAVLEGE